jgi:hypothetical protein
MSLGRAIRREVLCCGYLGQLAVILPFNIRMPLRLLITFPFLQAVAGNEGEIWEEWERKKVHVEVYFWRAVRNSRVSRKVLFAWWVPIESQNRIPRSAKSKP